MESSVFGTPVAPATMPPEQAAATEQQAPQSAEPTQPEPTQQTAEQQQQTLAEQPDVMGAIEELKQQVSQAIPQQPAPEPALDLLTALEGEPEGAPEQAQQVAPEQQQVAEPAQQELEELRQFVRAEAQEMVRPWMQEQAEREIRTIPNEFPDILSKEVLPDLERTVEDFIRDTGDESLRFNPDFIRRAYKLVKAEQAESGAAPAEQVATQGASLETNAGQTQTGAPLPDEQYKSAVYGNNQTPSVFG